MAVHGGIMRNRRPRLPSSFPRKSVPEALGALHWFTADNFTLSANNLATLPNRGTAGGVLSSAGATIPEPIADANFSGKKCLTVGGTQWLDSSLPASSWRFLHDGLGCEIYHVFRPSTLNSAHSLSATCRETAAIPGHNCYIGATGATRTGVTNDASVYKFIDSSAGTFPVNVTSVIGYSLSATDLKLYDTAGNVITNSAVFAASANNPNSALRLFAWSNGSVAFIGKWATMIAFNRVLSGAERTALRAYISAEYGV